MQMLLFKSQKQWEPLTLAFETENQKSAPLSLFSGHSKIWESFENHKQEIEPWKGYI